MNWRENHLRTVHYGRPEYIPISFTITGGCWNHYPHEELKDLKASHPVLFPGYKKEEGQVTPYIAPWRKKGVLHTDSWGCVWESVEDGITGAVTKHPLETWDAFEDFTPPDPEHEHGWEPIDWNQVGERFKKNKESGSLVSGGLRHGHTFLTLTYLRGYENVIFDMADNEPRLNDLIRMVEEFNAGLVKRYLERGAEWIGFPEDLGMQVGPMLSPEFFKTYLKPVYTRLMTPAREKGCVVHMHSDGDIRDLAEDLIECGVQALNLQDLVNGIDWIKENLKGRICIDLDIDRQKITRFGTPAEIDDLVRKAVEELGNPEGGLMLKFGFVPGAPLENIRALMDAMEKYSLMYS